MTLSLVEKFKALRRAGGPLAAIRSTDVPAAIREVCEALKQDVTSVPLVRWDCSAGFVRLNKAGQDALKDLDALIVDPAEAMREALKLPAPCVLFAINLHLHWSDPVTLQAITNLREPFKSEEGGEVAGYGRCRTLVAVGVGVEIPMELSDDVVVLDQAKPDAEALRSIVLKLHEAGEVQKPDEDQLQHAVEAVRGLSAFAAEQATAMSLRKSGLRIDEAWERKVQAIEATPGLKVWRGKTKFKELGGLRNLKKFFARLLAGPKRPVLVFFWDEIEKMFAGSGAGGDTSGTSQRQFGKVLTWMNDRQVYGVMLVGVAGGGKTAIGRAVGGEAGIPVVNGDFADTFDSLVGGTETKTRNMLSTVDAMAGDVEPGRILVIATSNNTAALPAELKRAGRFSATFFVDLPTEEERNVIWPLCLEPFGIPLNAPRPNDAGWTGAEIRECCRLAQILDVTPQEAAAYIVPVAQADAGRISHLRRQATGRFISASYDGPYRMDEENAAEATEILEQNTSRLLDLPE